MLSRECLSEYVHKIQKEKYVKNKGKENKDNQIAKGKKIPRKLR